jgi:hypothetical protein
VGLVVRGQDPTWLIVLMLIVGFNEATSISTSGCHKAWSA